MHTTRQETAVAAKNKTFRVPVDLAHRAEAKAQREHRSLNAIVLDLLESYAGGREHDLVAEIDAINARAERKRRGRPLKPAPSFSRDELHER